MAEAAFNMRAAGLAAADDGARAAEKLPTGSNRYDYDGFTRGRVKRFPALHHTAATYVRPSLPCLPAFALSAPTGWKVQAGKTVVLE